MDVVNLLMPPNNTMLLDILSMISPRTLVVVQHAELSDGTIVPYLFHSGNTYMKTSYPTDDNMDQYPHVIFTSDETWDPTAFDDPSDFDNDLLDSEIYLSTPLINDYGELIVDHCSQVCCKAHIANKAPDFVKLQPYLGWSPLDHVKRTLNTTTQYARAVERFPLGRHFKTHFPSFQHSVSLMTRLPLILSFLMSQPMMMASWDMVDPPWPNSTLVSTPVSPNASPCPMNHKWLVPFRILFASKGPPTHW